MKLRRYFAVILGIFFILYSVNSVLAITASIGSSRMILRLNVEEKVERSILVKNINDVPVTITLNPIGELADNVELSETEFELLPKEEKNVKFTIFADEAGTTETKIQVGFKPAEGNGVGLSSTIIIIAGDSVETINEENEEVENNQELQDSNNELEGSISSQTNQQNTLENQIYILKIFFILTIILIAILIILFFYYLNTKKQISVNEETTFKKSRRKNE